MPAEQPERPELAGGEEVVLSVLKRCPNPRLVMCSYGEGEFERRVLVRVGRNGKFATGMKLKALRPQREGEVWVYTGALPRLPGRW